ncbi:hypothetical protein B0H14DRAFT_2559478 [Mycena olivaceomarginata]|nr:hypothetical protein B0H14DRAFT_2559478 [Mycena olivaceomarginata]
MRQGYLKHPDGDFWDQLDDRLNEIRNEAKNDAKKLTRGFRHVLTHDQDKHGGKDYVLDETTVDDFQQQVDDTIAVDTATSTASFCTLLSEQHSACSKLSFLGDGVRSTSPVAVNTTSLIELTAWGYRISGYIKSIEAQYWLRSVLPADLEHFTSAYNLPRVKRITSSRCSNASRSSVSRRRKASFVSFCFD